MNLFCSLRLSIVISIRTTIGLIFIALLTSSQPALTEQSKSASCKSSPASSFCPFQRTADHQIVRKRANANILQPSYTRLSNGQGQFRGFVSGQGTVHLNLVFFEGEKVVARKYMGYVQLKAGEKQVPFRFETAIPPGSSLKWRILASEIS